MSFPNSGLRSTSRLGRPSAAVAASAGAAASAYARHGGTFTMRNAAYVMNDVDPVTNWEMSLRDPEQLRPEEVVSSVELSAIARATQEEVEAAGRERGLTGLIAAFLRLAIGPSRGCWARAPRTTGGGERDWRHWAAALGGALSVGLVAGAVALWNLVF